MSAVTNVKKENGVLGSPFESQKEGHAAGEVVVVMHQAFLSGRQVKRAQVIGGRIEQGVLLNASVRAGRNQSLAGRPSYRIELQRAFARKASRLTRLFLKSPQPAIPYVHQGPRLSDCENLLLEVPP